MPEGKRARSGTGFDPAPARGRSALKDYVYERLSKNQAYQEMEFLSLLADNDLWGLMQIPFSPELVAFTRQGAEPAAVSAEGRARAALTTPETQPVESKDQTIVREAIARALGKDPAEVVNSDYEGVTELDLSYSSVQSLEEVCRLKSLQKLAASNCEQLTGVEPLQRLTNLQSLDLGGTQVSSIEPLRGLTNLRTLDLFGTPVSSVEPLKGLTNLQTLCLGDTQVSSVEPLQGLTNLQLLDLGATQINSVEALRGLTKLQTPGLSGTPLSSFEPLKRLTNLQSLDLSGTQVSSVAPLKRLTNLQSLYLSETQVSGEQIAELRKRLPKANIVR